MIKIDDVKLEIAKHSQEKVTAAMEVLTDKERQVFEARFMLGATRVDTARNMGVTAATVAHAEQRAARKVAYFLLPDVGAQLVSELKLSMRALTVLGRLGLVTVAECEKLTRRDLKESKNCGTQTIAEIESALSREGISIDGKTIDPSKRAIWVCEKLTDGTWETVDTCSAKDFERLRETLRHRFPTALYSGEIRMVRYEATKQIVIARAMFDQSPA